MNKQTVYSILFIISLLLSGAMAANCQTFTALTASAGFNVESGTATDSTFVVDGKTWPVFQTAKGSKYIKCTSAKSGNLYPVWIGKETSYRHEGRKVYQSKKGSYCIYKTGKTGNPYPVWLRLQD